jgi:hypothetical protein
MAIAIIHFFPGGTKKQYDAALAVVHPSRTQLPKGQLYHAAGASPGGFTIIAVHDSKESWEAFRDNVLRPKLAAGIPGGFTTEPKETVFELDNLQASSMAKAA